MEHPDIDAETGKPVAPNKKSYVKQYRNSNAICPIGEQPSRSPVRMVRRKRKPAAATGRGSGGQASGQGTPPTAVPAASYPTQAPQQPPEPLKQPEEAQLPKPRRSKPVTKDLGDVINDQFG